MKKKYDWNSLNICESLKTASFIFGKALRHFYRNDHISSSAVFDALRAVKSNPGVLVISDTLHGLSLLKSKKYYESAWIAHGPTETSGLYFSAPFCALRDLVLYITDNKTKDLYDKNISWDTNKNNLNFEEYLNCKNGEHFAPLNADKHSKDHIVPGSIQYKDILFNFFIEDYQLTISKVEQFELVQSTPEIKALAQLFKAISLIKIGFENQAITYIESLFDTTENKNYHMPYLQIIILAKMSLSKNI